MSATLAAAVVAAAASVVPSPAGAVIDTSAAASVVSEDKDVSDESYPSVGPHGSPNDKSWRVVSAASGNPFENYLAATPGGRILNWGGSYLHFSDDGGQSWSSVRPTEPLLGAEGAVVVAPDGDIVGVTWDPYSGDRLLAFKHDGSGWRYAPVLLHTPFYDRPWIAVVPGPLSFAGQTYEYASVIRGGWPSKEVWYVSFDGLTYIRPTSKQLESLVGPALTGPLTPVIRPSADWIQPHTESNVTPLNGGGALAGQLDGALSCDWKKLDANVTWRCFSFGGSQPGEGRLLADSRGYLHHLNVDAGVIVYQLSRDGGATWEQTTTNLPAGHEAEDWDVKTNGERKATAVAIHAHRSGDDEADQDLVYRYEVSEEGPPSFKRRYNVGLGDHDFGSGATSNQDRFDFASVAILPTGKIAVSFGDSEHTEAALAIEQ